MKTYKCMNCGAALNIGNKKIVKCEYCDSEIHIDETVERELKIKKHKKFNKDDLFVVDISRDTHSFYYRAIIKERPECQYFENNYNVQQCEIFKVIFEIDRYDQIKIISYPVDLIEERDLYELLYRERYKHW